MRKLEPIEIEFALTLFVVVVPWGWFAARTFLALITT